MAQFKRPKLKGFLPRGTTFLKKDEIYPEITGYAATSFARLYLRKKNIKYLRRSMMASDALLRFIQSSGAIPGVIHKDCTFENLVYTFDHGMMARGLFSTYQACILSGNRQCKKYKNNGLKAVDFLLKIQGRDGDIPAECELDGSNPSEFRYCIMGKLIIPFVQAFQLTKKEKYLFGARAIADHIIKIFQNEKGVFCLLKYIKYQNRVHYHCYSLEGLMKLYEVTGQKKYYKSIRSGADFLIGIQKPNGGFFYEIPGNLQVKWEDPPAAPQAIRIWLFMYKITKENKYLEASKNSIKYLRGIQYRTRIGRLYGGLPPLIPYHKKTSCTWVVEFAIDAFYQYQRITSESNL